MLKLILIMAIFFLNGCNEPDPLPPEQVFVEKPNPRFKILNKVEFYKIQDYRSFDDKYWLINKDEFNIASDRVIKKDYKIRYYEKWGMRYNKEFVDVNKTNL